LRARVSTPRVASATIAAGDACAARVVVRARRPRSETRIRGRRRSFSGDEASKSEIFVFTFRETLDYVEDIFKKRVAAVPPRRADSRYERHRRFFTGTHRRRRTTQNWIAPRGPRGGRVFVFSNLDRNSNFQIKAIRFACRWRAARVFALPGLRVSYGTFESPSYLSHFSPSRLRSTAARPAASLAAMTR